MWPVTDVVVPRAGLHPVTVIVDPPTVEPLTLAQGKLRAGLDWSSGDPRDDLMLGFIAAARAYLEADASLALLPQTRAIYFDALPPVVELLVRPLTVVTVAAILTDGSESPLDTSLYAVDLVGARVAFSSGVVPTVAGQRTFQPWVITIVAGYDDVDALPADLVHAVGILTAHYATTGRDLVWLGHMVAEVPFGYEELIAPWRPQVLP